VAIVMVPGVGRAGAVLVIDEETASFTGETHGSSVKQKTEAFLISTDRDSLRAT
jgi:hypothetical protein